MVGFIFVYSNVRFIYYRISNPKPRKLISNFTF